MDISKMRVPPPTDGTSTDSQVEEGALIVMQDKLVISPQVDHWIVRLGTMCLIVQLEGIQGGRFILLQVLRGTYP